MAAGDAVRVDPAGARSLQSLGPEPLTYWCVQVPADRRRRGRDRRRLARRRGPAVGVTDRPPPTPATPAAAGAATVRERDAGADAGERNALPDGRGSRPVSPGVRPSVPRRLAPAAAGAAMLAVGAGLVAAVAGGGDDAGPAGETVRPVAVAVRPVVVRDGYVVSRSFLGRVEPRREAALAFERPGVVAAVLVEEGDSVEAGQTLAKLDVAKPTAARAAAAARLAAAEALLAELVAGPRGEDVAAAAAEAARQKALAERAVRASNRVARMAGRGSVTEQDVDDARLAADAAKAALAAARSGLEELRAGTRPERLAAQRAEVARATADLAAVDVDLAKSELVAPFAGTVAARLADEGAVPAAGTPVLELLETAAPRVRAGVAGGAAGDFAAGQLRRVTVATGPAGGATFTATVAAVRPDRAGRGRTVDVLLDLPADAAGRVRRGDLARLPVDRRVDEPCVAVPVAALTESRRGLWAALVAEPLVAETRGPAGKSGRTATEGPTRTPPRTPRPGGRWSCCTPTARPPTSAARWPPGSCSSSPASPASCRACRCGRCGARRGRTHNEPRRPVPEKPVPALAGGRRAAGGGGQFAGVAAAAGGPADHQPVPEHRRGLPRGGRRTRGGPADRADRGRAGGDPRDQVRHEREPRRRGVRHPGTRRRRRRAGVEGDFRPHPGPARRRRPARRGPAARVRGPAGGQHLDAGCLPIRLPRRLVESRRGVESPRSTLAAGGRPRRPAADPAGHGIGAAVRRTGGGVDRRRRPRRVGGPGPDARRRRRRGRRGRRQAARRDRPGRRG